MNDHIDAILYHARNLLVCDEEETRIADDLSIPDYLPEGVVENYRVLISQHDYEAAIRLFLTNGIHKEGLNQILKEVPVWVEAFIVEEFILYPDDEVGQQEEREYLNEGIPKILNQLT